MGQGFRFRVDGFWFRLESGCFNSGCDVFCWVLGVCGVFLRRVPRDGFLKAGALHDAVGLVYDLGFGVWCFETSLQGKLGSPPYLLKLM